MNQIATDSLTAKPIPKTRSPLHFLFEHPLALETETSWFLLFGVLDLVLTTVLLRTGAAHEANPLARFIISEGGLPGLIGYKLGLLTLAAVSTQVIVLSRPRAAKAVLHTGIAMQLLVVGYSVLLLAKIVL
jgi:hypothetical protein